MNSLFIKDNFNFKLRDNSHNRNEVPHYRVERNTDDYDMYHVWYKVDGNWCVKNYSLDEVKRFIDEGQWILT